MYGVTAAATRLPDGLTGLDGAGVRLVAHGPVAAVVGQIALERPPGRRAELLAYSGVLDAVAQTAPVAPVQFGSVLADEESVVADLLAPQAGELEAMLGGLAGRRQLTLRATYLEHVVLAEVVAADPEIRDLRERTRELPEDAAVADRIRLGELVARAVEERREVDAETLLDEVLPHTAAYRLRPGSGLEHVVDAALLVDEDRRPDLERRLEDLAEALHERIRLQLVGPMAPYDFTGGA